MPQLLENIIFYISIRLYSFNITIFIIEIFIKAQFFLKTINLYAWLDQNLKIFFCKPRVLYNGIEIVLDYAVVSYKWIKK